MGSGFDMSFSPNRRRARLYTKLYGKYAGLGGKLEGLLRAL
jgi:hypothetical protein